MVGQPALELVGVEARYGDTIALAGLDLEVRQGELLTLLGPSGSGKTTALMIAAGFVTPTAGTVRLNGRDITSLSPQKRDIGVVFQHYALFPHRTVAQNVAFPLRMRHVAKAEQAARVERTLETVRLSGLGGRYPDELSGGQQQRVALARAMVFNPPILLMDEPLGALDKSLRNEMQLEIKRIQEELDLTIVYVTHDQEEALTLSHRVGVVHDARLEQVADPETLYTRPASPFVAGFVGDTNLFTGCIEVGPDTLVLQSESGLTLPVGAGAEGERSSLTVRPEAVQMAPPGVGSWKVTLPGTVTTVVYLGDATTYSVELADGTVVRSKRPTDHGASRFSRGAAVEVGWDVESSYLIEEAGPA